MNHAERLALGVGDLVQGLQARRRSQSGDANGRALRPGCAGKRLNRAEAQAALRKRERHAFPRRTEIDIRDFNFFYGQFQAIDSVSMAIAQSQIVNDLLEMSRVITGKMRLEGRDYVVADGDVMHFRFAT